MENQLISAAKLKVVCFIHGNVEESKLGVLITRVQDLVIEPAISTPLFKRLLEAIPNDLTADEIILMDKYIIPLIGAACDRRAINAITFQLRNKGTGTMRDENFDHINQNENIRITEDFNKDVAMYRRRLIGYLKDNKDLYPLYTTCADNHEDIPGSKVDYKSNISIL